VSLTTAHGWPLMLGQRSSQLGMFTADQQYLDMVGADSFYGLLARHGRELFRDEDFSGLYCRDNGRHSVPPSLLCLALRSPRRRAVGSFEAEADHLLRLGRECLLHIVSHHHRGEDHAFWELIRDGQALCDDQGRVVTDPEHTLGFTGVAARRPPDRLRLMSPSCVRSEASLLTTAIRAAVGSVYRNLGDDFFDCVGIPPATPRLDVMHSHRFMRIFPGCAREVPGEQRHRNGRRHRACTEFRDESAVGEAKYINVA